MTPLSLLCDLTSFASYRVQAPADGSMPAAAGTAAVASRETGSAADSARLLAEMEQAEAAETERVRAEVARLNSELLEARSKVLLIPFFLLVAVFYSS
jgi:hypothetical protein